MPSAPTLLCQLCGEACADEWLCEDCGALAYCSKRHRRIHFRQGHAEECSRMAEQVKRASEIFSCPLAMSLETLVMAEGASADCCSILKYFGIHLCGLWQSVCDCAAADSRSWGHTGLARLNLGSDTGLFGCTPLENVSTSQEDGIEKENTGTEQFHPQTGSWCPMNLCVMHNRRQRLHELQIDNRCQHSLWNLTCNRVPCFDSALGITREFDSWSDYYMARGLPLDSPAALLLHHPLTLHYALMATNPSSRVRMAGTTCIHYLGPQRELDAIESFTELGCLLPAHHIRIVFVGPDVPHALDGASLLRPSPRVPLCGNVACSCAAAAREPVSDGTSRSRTPAASSVDEAGIGDRDAFPGWAGSQGSLRMDFHRGLYHDWIGGLAEEGAEQRAPDLVFAANAGLEAYAGWRPSLERLEAGVPLVVTDYCEEAAARAGVVLGALGLRVRSVGLNPFRQPVRDRRAGNNLPSCSNGFVLVAERAGSRRGGHASWDGCVRSS